MDGCRISISQLPPPEVLEKATTDVASGRMGKQELAHMFAEYLGGLKKER